METIRRTSLFLFALAALSLALFSSCSRLGIEGSLVAQGKRNPAAVEFSCNELIREVLQTKFIKSKDNFKKALKKNFTARKARTIEQNLDALLFIDYKHAYPLLKDIYAGQKYLFTESIFDLYSNSGGSKVFKNYVQASKFLLENKPDFSIDSLKRVHSLMMKGPIDGIPEGRIGTFRREDIIGNVPAGYDLNEKQFQALVDNPYINTERLKESANGYVGYIGYPNAAYNTSEVMEIIAKRNEDLHEKLVAFKSKNITQGGEFEELTGSLINELTEDLLDWFVKQKDQIGPIDNVRKFKKYVKLVAQYQRGLVSIHPFYDGNGRSIRQFALYYPFWVEGLPPPRIVDVNNDLYTSLDDWSEQISDGVISSHRLFTELSKRLAAPEYRLGSAPELLFPNIPKEVKVTFRSQKPRKTIKGKRVMEVDGPQFSEYVFTRIKSEEGLEERYLTDPDTVLKELSEDYIKFAESSYMDYRHAKFGDEFIGLEFVEQDFIETFADQSYKKKDKWLRKMERWYNDQTIWRGLSRQNQEIEESEIVSMFSNLHYQFVSNHALSFSREPDKMLSTVMDDFKDYNKQIIDGGIVRMAKDHSESGPLYGESYGYSTSKKWEVGRAFAMGAMVVAEYGQHWDHQHLLKSRVLVGMKEARKDVDLGRLKQLRNEFSYKYPRQVEVMGVGGADPDSVMFVQLINAEGDAYLSYVRNPKKPSEILVFEGDIQDTSKLPRNPLKRINLP